MYRNTKSVLAALLLLNTSETIGKAPTAVPESPLTYADVADLSLAASIVAEVRIAKAERIDGKSRPMPAGMRRYLITAKVTALIRGNEGLPPVISYLADSRADSLGRFPKWPKQAMIIFAVPVANRPSEVRLVAPDAQQPLTPALSIRTRAILADIIAPDAAPRVLRVGDAFHVPGSVPGDGETQIFLAADDGRPLSMNVWRRQNEPPRWSISVGEIVDEGAPPPPRDSLLWYRLACFIPQSLPAASVDALDADAARIASEDYATVMKGLGPCPRSRAL
jgi:hypothetical protein